MPITYEVDESLNVIFETWEGTITARDLDMYWREYLADQKVLSCRRTLVDVRKSNITFTGDQFHQLIASVAVPMLGEKKWCTAILVGLPVQFGVARQYQVFADIYSSDSIFDNKDRAIDWLLKQNPEL